MLDWIHENATEEIVYEYLEKKCKQYPDFIATPCKSIAQSIAFIVPKLGELLDYQEIIPIDICGVVNQCHIDCCNTEKPEQVRISLTGDHRQMVVSWITQQRNPGFIQYWSTPNKVITRLASIDTFTNGGWQGYILNVTISDLSENMRYSYRVGSDRYGWSSEFTFKTFVNSNYSNLPVRWAISGDIGASDSSNNTLNNLVKLIQNRRIDGLIHCGDIGYADGIQRIWDLFGRKIEPVTSTIPYMVTPGNHEIAYVTYLGLETFHNRWFMPYYYAPNSADSYPYFYSIDYGNLHIISLNTEHPLNFPYISDLQYKWLELDLIKANQARQSHPWIIVTTHRPFYCTSTRTRECKIYGDVLLERLEDLLARYNVDIVFSGHLHYYERTWPVFKNITDKRTVDPKFPIYIVNGAGGNREGTSGMLDDVPDWTAFRFKDWGYGLLEATNNTHLKWEFYNSTNNVLVDEFTIVKTMY